MSAPLIVPNGNDRSMTRGMYYVLRRFVRYEWWKNDCDAKIQRQMTNLIIYGTTHPELHNNRQAVQNAANGEM